MGQVTSHPVFDAITTCQLTRKPAGEDSSNTIDFSHEQLLYETPVKPAEAHFKNTPVDYSHEQPHDYEPPAVRRRFYTFEGKRENYSNDRGEVASLRQPTVEGDDDSHRLSVEEVEEEEEEEVSRTMVREDVFDGTFGFDDHDHEDKRIAFMHPDYLHQDTYVRTPLHVVKEEDNESESEEEDVDLSAFRTKVETPMSFYLPAAVRMRPDDHVTRAARTYRVDMEELDDSEEEDMGPEQSVNIVFCAPGEERALEQYYKVANETYQFTDTTPPGDRKRVIAK